MKENSKLRVSMNEIDICKSTAQPVSIAIYMVGITTMLLNMRKKCNTNLN